MRWPQILGKIVKRLKRQGIGLVPSAIVAVAIMKLTPHVGSLCTEVPSMSVFMTDNQKYLKVFSPDPSIIQDNHSF